MMWSFFVVRINDQWRICFRYKELVKRHHPDTHGGDKEAEERLKEINQAYSTLKASYFPT